MTNSDQSAVNPALAVPPVPLTHKKSYIKWYIIGAAAVGGLCLLVGLCVVSAGAALFGVASQKGDVEASIDAFMQAMTNKNTQQAYALFATRAQRQTPISKFNELIDGANFALFDGYQKVTLENINITQVANTDPDVPQGTVARVSGTVTYLGDFEGALHAILEQGNGKWKLYTINVTVPPN